MEREELEIERVAKGVLTTAVGISHRTPMQKRHMIGFLKRIAEQLPVAIQFGAPFVTGRAVSGERITLKRVGPLAKIIAQALLGAQIDEDEPLPEVERD